MLRKILIALTLTLPAIADTPIALDPATARDLTIAPQPDGSLGLTTTGRDPRIHTLPIPPTADLTRDRLLAFEYFSLTGTDGMQLFLVPPTTEAASTKAPGLTRAEAWTTRTIPLPPGPATTLRIDFGNTPAHTLSIRSLTLRPPTEPERIAADRIDPAAEAAREHTLRTYLDTIFPNAITRVTVTADTITITGTAQNRATLIEIPITSELGDPFQPLHPTSGTFTHTLPRFVKSDTALRDRIFSRWAIATTTAGKTTLASHARYPDEIPCPAPPPIATPRNRKGLGGLWHGRPLSDLDDLGISHATVNILLSSLLSAQPGKDRTPFTYSGHTWYARTGYLHQLDTILREAAQRSIIISAIILIPRAEQWPEKPLGHLIAHPDADPAGHFAMPNVNSPAGHTAYAAAIHLLASRYTGGENGRIHHWIAHNEVDAGWEWTNAGVKTALRYLDLYHKSMRTLHLITRQHDPHAKTFISLTHYWAQKAHPHFYPSRLLLDHLLDYSRTEGDFDWAIAHHPYPQDLRNPRTWEDKLATFTLDTPQITFRNIEVLHHWALQPRTMYLGKTPRTIHLTEQAPNSPDYTEKSLTEQAAAMAYLWAKLKPLPTITAFHFHNWQDNRHEGGLRIGLRKYPDDPQDPNGKKPIWHLYKALDTPEETTASAFALPIIGITDWTQARHQKPIPEK